jgi:hypothetical protein
MSIRYSSVAPHRSVDATGRALPMTVEEIRTRAIEIARGLDALDDMGDQEEQRQTLDALTSSSNSPNSDVVRERFESQAGNSDSPCC